MSTKLEYSCNVQTVVSKVTHKSLKDEAYAKNVTLRDLLREILEQHSAAREARMKS